MITGNLLIKLIKLIKRHLAAFSRAVRSNAHLRRCRRHYTERKSLFLEQVSKCELPLNFPITGREMNLADMLPDIFDDRVWSDRLRAVALDVPLLSNFAVRPTRPGLLFGLAAFDKLTILRGVARMTKAFEGR